jgi:nucleotide-binding universal stress UspA family protein
MASLERGAEDASARLRTRFDSFVAERDIPQMPLGAATDSPSASWREAGLAEQESIGSRGRAFQLLVVGRPVTGQFAPSMVALEAALFESGRPVLVAPPKPPSTLGENIAVAWNGSTETARTIAFATPFLRRAEEVTVISTDEGMVPGPSGQEVAQHLVRAGISARTRQVRCAGRPVGGAILEETASIGADLLVKGAYTQSRLRQMIFGGATSHILAHATLPVLMAN